MLYIAIGIIGATVMPHNLYLHSSIVQTRAYPRTDEGRRDAIKWATTDSTIALMLALFINAAILVVAAATFHKSGHSDVAEIGQAFELLSPLLGLGIASLHLLGGALATGMLFLSLLPSTVQSSIAFTAMARGNVAAAVCSASMSNLIGIVATPLLVQVAMHPAASAGGGMAWGSVKTIALQLLLPFVAGHLLRPWIGGFVARHQAVLQPVYRGSILLVVYAAF
ncbi:hypothetical protein LTR94_030437, partial [Friedmanniomyces endolithicus]